MRLHVFVLDGLAHVRDLALPPGHDLRDLALEQLRPPVLILYGKLQLSQPQVLVQAQGQLVTRTHYVHFLLQCHLLQPQLIEGTVRC